MKKRLIASILALVMCLALAACGGSSSPAAATSAPAAAASEAPAAAEAPAEETHKVGACVQDMGNPVWSTQLSSLGEQCEKMGWTFTAVQHDDDPAKCVTQIENFVTSGCDFIFIQCGKEEGIADAVKAAQDQGVTVIGTGAPLTCADANYYNDNYGAGYVGGEIMGKWANETFGEDYTLRVAQLGYYSHPLILARTDGQIDGLTATHPNFEIVAQQDILTNTEAMNATEAILTNSRDVDCLFAWGDGFALSALEVVRSFDMEGEKFGIVGLDGTEEAANEIAAGSSMIGTCSLGSSVQLGIDQFNIIQDILAGNNQKEYFTPNIPVDRSNVEEYLNAYYR